MGIHAQQLPSLQGAKTDMAEGLACFANAALVYRTPTNSRPIIDPGGPRPPASAPGTLVPTSVWFQLSVVVNTEEKLITSVWKAAADGH